MSILIDKLIKDLNDNPSLTSQNNIWYVAKPINFFSIKEKLKRFKDGIRVMKGKSFAVHYKQDEK